MIDALGSVDTHSAELMTESEKSTAAATAIILAVMITRTVSVLRVLNLIEHEVLDQIDRAATLHTWSTASTIIVLSIGGAICSVT